MKIVDSDAYRVKLADAVEDGYLDADTIETAINILDCEQAIDAAPVVHAHWIIRNWGDWAECSRCHRTVDGAYDLNEYLDHISGLAIPDRMSYFCADAYCRCCGAKMDERPDNAEHCAACGDTKAAAFGDFMFLKPSAETSDVHAYEFDQVRGEYVQRKLTIGNIDGRQSCPSYEKEVDSDG